MSARSDAVLNYKEQNKQEESVARYQGLLARYEAQYEFLVAKHEKLNTLDSKIEPIAKKFQEAKDSYGQAISLIDSKQLEPKMFAIFEKGRFISEVFDDPKEMEEILGPTKKLFKETYNLIKESVEIMEELQEYGTYQRNLAVFYISLAYLSIELGRMEFNPNHSYHPFKNAIDYLEQAEKIVRSEMLKNAPIWKLVAYDIRLKYQYLKNLTRCHDGLYKVVYARFNDYYNVLRDLEALLKKGSEQEEPKTDTPDVVEFEIETPSKTGPNNET